VIELDVTENFESLKLMRNQQKATDLPRESCSLALITKTGVTRDVFLLVLLANVKPWTIDVKTIKNLAS
jgi:hypothetical protein